MLVQELQTIVPLYLVHLLKKQCRVPGMRALIRLITWFLSAVKDLPVQNWGITFSERKYWCKENVPCKNVEIFEMKFWLGKGEYSRMTHGINMKHGIKNMWTERMYFNPCWVVSIAYITRWLLRNWCLGWRVLDRKNSPAVKESETR